MIGRREVEQRINDLRDRHVAELTSMQAQIDRRTEADMHESELRFAQLDARLAIMNEFRDSIRDQALQFMTRTEITAITSRIETRLDKIESTQDRQRGRMAAYAIMLSVVVLGLTVLTLVLDHVKF